jgi:large subunit ribosomal protein L29
MKPNDLRTKTDSELDGLLSELHREQFNLRMQKVSGQISKPDQVKKIRKDIARVNTILTEKGRAV